MSVILAVERDMRRSRVEIVLADEDHRRALHGRQVQPLVKCADVGGAVAEEADRHAVEAEHAERHGAAGGDRDVGADDGVGDHGADREVGKVHLPALAADAAGRLAPDLGGDGVERRALGDQVPDRPVGAEDRRRRRAAPSRRPPPPPPGPGTGAACPAPDLAGRAGRGAPRSGGSAPSSQRRR